MLTGQLDVLEWKQFAAYLSPRKQDADKSDFGHVLVVGGDYGFSGAARMAGEAALRVGAGRVSIATRPEHALMLNAVRPELMCHGITQATELESLLARATVVIIGPGMGRGPWAQKLLYTVLKADKTVIVVDADGLNLLAERPSRKDNWILTPHVGEAARLLKTTVEMIQKDRVAAATELQQKFGGICILKGAGTLVAGTDAKIAICHQGNPGMASGGMGDVLSGVIGGLLAQHVPANEAAKLGVLTHALAGDLAAKQGGERGMIATDLMPYLRELMNRHVT